MKSLFAQLVVLQLLLISQVVAEQQPQTQLKQIQSQISDLSSEISASREQREQQQALLEKIERQIGSLGRSIHNLQNEIGQYNRQLDKLATQRAQQQQQLYEERKKLSVQMVSAYAMGRQERIKMLLNQQDPVLLNRVMSYYDYLNRERITRIQQANRLIEQLQQTENDITLARQQLDASFAEKNARLEEIHAARQSRAELVARLDSDIKSKGESLQRLKRDAARLERLLSEIQQREQRRQQFSSNQEKKFASMRGQLPWPARGRLQVLYGAPKSGDVKWDGVFITAPEGEQIHAVHHGRVAYADWLRGYGLLLIIDHGDGFMTLYGHNQSLFKETGEWVAGGEPIALVGNSGGQKLSGLYFSIRKDGRPNNPGRWCVKTHGRVLR
ncbi:MAG: peptidoglycan DD-metalloendopeptidase family protein [Chromatiales bacterium]|jgi:septal ring factor EnvC (AmiA/AmiB activator)